jgi:NADH-quinone oxidoreductase subunit A
MVLAGPRKSESWAVTVRETSSKDYNPGTVALCAAPPSASLAKSPQVCQHPAMSTPWLPIFLFAAIATFMALSILIVAQVVGPKRRGAVKEMPYESGMDPVHSARQRFPISFYLLAIEFLVFDVELLFLYPWAVAAHEAGAFGAGHGVFFAVLGFIAILLVGFVYTWRKDVFKFS